MKVMKKQPVLALKPTQFSVGVAEVEYKVIELKKLSTDERNDVLKTKLIPVVVSPWGDLYIIDHHHFLFACWHAGIYKVYVEVIKDFSGQKMSYRKFWQKMVKNHYAYLYDQFGEGPRDPLYLPMDIRGMADDPYRSLAWIVRKEGAYKETDETFVEFQWADFFRRKKLLEAHGRQGLKEAVQKAYRWAHSKEAKELPGYIGVSKKKIKRKKVSQRLQRTRYVPPSQVVGPLASVPVVQSHP